MNDSAQEHLSLPAAGQADSPIRGLVVWLGVLVVGGLVLIVTGQADGAALLVVAGQFLAARIADRDESWSLFNIVAQLLTPALGAIAFGALAWASWHAEVPAPARVIAAGWCGAATLISLALYARPFTNAVAALLFRTIAPNHVLRLAARLVVLGLLLPVPALVMSGTLLEALARMGDTLADPARLLASLAGEIVLALAAVGYLIDRDDRGTLRRLGLGPIGGREAGVAALGVVAALALTASLEFVQQHIFPATWRFDQQVVKAIAGQMPLSSVILLGLSAGIGEEVAVRGALQPRLGILLSSLLFACLHVQYSWFGMLSVGLLGVLLGVIRKRTNTTTAMLVHAAYDMIAAFATTRG